MKVKFKAHDESGSIDELRVRKWGYNYYTTDTQISTIKEREERKRNREAGNTSMFGSGKGGIQLKVIISNKMKNERLPEDIDKFQPRSPTLLRFKNVRYNVKDNIVFIN